MKTIEELMANMKAILSGAEGRSLTDEEVENYEKLEGELANVRKSGEIRSRHNAYETPVGSPLNAVESADQGDADMQMRAFEHFLRTGQKNSDLIEARAQSSGTGSEGGYTVPTGFLEKIVEVRAKIGGFAPLAEELPTATGEPLEFPSIDDTANSGVIEPENAAIEGGADLVFGTINLGAFKYASGGGSNLPLRVPVELLQDARFDVTDLVTRKMGQRIARTQAADWTTGVGTTEPKGITDTTIDVALGTSNPVTYAKMLDLEDTLDEEYKQNAVHVMNSTTWKAWRTLDDGGNRPIILSQAVSGIGVAAPKMLGGYPVIIDNTMPNIADDVVFQVFGDFREAYIIRRVGSMVVVANPWTRASFGQVEFTAWERADGNIQNRSAYVTLAGEPA